MISRTGEKLIFALVLLCGPAVGLAITPTYSNDPINIPKFFLLTLFAMTILGSRSQPEFETSLLA
jgi:hypothetical protein